MTSRETRAHRDQIFGDDYAVLRAKAREVAERISDIPGLVDLYPGFEGTAPVALPDRQCGGSPCGTSASDVAGDLDDSLHGVVASILRRPDRPIGVRVRYPDAIRFDPSGSPNSHSWWSGRHHAHLAVATPYTQAPKPCWSGKVCDRP